MNGRAEDWRLQAESLLQAARDVRRDAPPAPKYVRAGREHTALFERYTQDLRHAKGWAESWWASLIQTEEKRTHDRGVAARTVAARNPVGQVAHPAVIAVVRRYWLACVALNAHLPPEEQMPPEEFLLSSLLHPPQEELARFLSALPYWPVGMDAGGQWV